MSSLGILKVRKLRRRRVTQLSQRGVRTDGAEPFGRDNAVLI